MAFDPPQGAGGGGGSSGGFPYSGARVKLTSPYSLNAGTAEQIPFGSGTELADTDDYHDVSTNSERLTIPSAKAGSYFKVSAQADFDEDPTNSMLARVQWFDSSDVSKAVWSCNSIDHSQSGAFGVMIDSPVVQVASGDYFVLVMRSTPSGNFADVLCELSLYEVTDQ